ncbi:DUF1992 domain-containing protein [Sporolactobacillus sp. THM7-4]|nr:DUF1992 domain-containing protein [Sporolactobacillus sp. THM7-4]
MSIISILAESRIQEGLKEGAFENLPGKGKPQNFEDLSMVPEDLRLGYKVLKNAGYLPEELQLRKDMVTLSDLIQCCDDEHERTRLNQQLTEKRLRFNMLAEKRSLKKTSAFLKYRNKIFNRLHI